MISVIVTYTVNPEFVEKNKKNIGLFLSDFKKLNSKNFKYTVYLLSDGKTFVHVSNYETESIQKRLLDVPSFKEFQRQRDLSGLEFLPKIEVMHLVGSTQ